MIIIHIKICYDKNKYENTSVEKNKKVIMGFTTKKR